MTGQDVGQLTGVSVGRVVDVDVEVTGDHQWRCYLLTYAVSVNKLKSFRSRTNVMHSHENIS